MRFSRSVVFLICLLPLPLSSCNATPSPEDPLQLVHAGAVGENKESCDLPRPDTLDILSDVYPKLAELEPGMSEKEVLDILGPIPFETNRKESFFQITIIRSQQIGVDAIINLYFRDNALEDSGAIAVENPENRWESNCDWDYLY